RQPRAHHARIAASRKEIRRSTSGLRLHSAWTLVTLSGLRQRPSVPALSQGRRSVSVLWLGAASPSRRRRTALFHHRHRRPRRGWPSACRRDRLPAASLTARSDLAATYRDPGANPSARNQRWARGTTMGAADAWLRSRVQR